MRAIQLQEFGGPEAMQLVELPDPEPGDGEVVIEVARAGINFADTHVTRDDYLAKQQLPLIPGGEVAGRTPDGRRVAALVANGGYAERVAVPEAVLVAVPEGVSDEQAAGLLLQGLTARSLLRVSAHLTDGESVVVEAAAGGTGSLAVQLAKRMGAGRVIALASTEEKRELTRRLGADVAIDSRSDDLGSAILEANGGEPVDVVLEMSGGAAFEACLQALAPFGRLVTYGLASGEPAELRNVDLMRTSRAVVGFWLVHLFRRPQELRAGIAELLEAVASGELEVVIGATYPMSEVRRAHEEIAARTTQGKLLLDPSL
jgi:NADPH2:quinone reductase